MAARVTALRPSLSQTDALLIHDRIVRLPPARFANRRLYLPCIVFTVKRLGVQEFWGDLSNGYRARVLGVGSVEFQTQDRLSLTELRKLVFVHPWIRDLRDPLDGFEGWTRASDPDSESDSDRETEAGSSPTSPLNAVPVAVMDEHTRVLRLVARLQEPFHVLLLQQQPNGEFRRIAAGHEVVVPGIEPRINFARDVRIDVLEIL